MLNLTENHTTHNTSQRRKLKYPDEKLTCKCHNWGLWRRWRACPHGGSWQQGQDWGKTHPSAAEARLWHLLLVCAPEQPVQWNFGVRKVEQMKWRRTMKDFEKWVLLMMVKAFEEWVLIWFGVAVRVSGWIEEKPWF